jgi:hypothetical protein
MYSHRATLGVDIGHTQPRGEKRLSFTVRRVLKVRDEDSIIATQAARDEEKRKERWWLTSRGEEGLQLL